MIAKKTRFRPLDFAIIALCVALGVYVYFRIKYGLEYRGDWSVIPRFLFRRDTETGRVVPNFLMEGLFTTLKLSVWAVILATILGVITGLFRTGKNLFLRMVGRTYVELIRNLPPLVLIFIFYFFVVDQIMPLLGLEDFIRSRSDSTKAILAVFFAKESLFTQFISGVFTIAFFEGAYITEITLLVCPGLTRCALSSCPKQSNGFYLLWPMSLSIRSSTHPSPRWCPSKN